jgi:HEAT repeat protein
VDLQPLVNELLAPGNRDREATARQLAMSVGGANVLIAIVRRASAVPGDPAAAKPRRYAATVWDDESVAVAAVRGLADAGQALAPRLPEIVDVLVQAFRHGNWTSISRHAAPALVQMAPERALAELMAAAARPAGSDRDYVIADGLRALAAKGPAWQGSAIEPLSALLASRDWATGGAAADGLSRIDDDRAFDALLRGVEKYTHSLVLGDIIRGLASSPRAAARTGELVPLLERITLSATTGSWDAADALGTFGEGVERLRRLLSDQRGGAAVIHGLGVARDAAAVPLLITRLREPGSDVASVISALGEIGDPAAVPPLSAELGRPEATDHAARALANLGPDGILELTARMEDPDPLVRSSVRSSVAEYRPLVVPVMLATLDSSDELSKARAAHALALLQEQSAAESLRPLLRDHSPVVRLAAVDAMRELRSKPSAEVLAPMLGDPIPEIRAAAVSALAQNAAPEAGHFIPLLDDPSPEVRLAVVDACTATPDESVLPALRARLHDPDPRVQTAATRAIAAIGPTAVPTLSDLMAHSEASVRDTSATMLAGLGANGMDAITAAAASENPLMRASAAAGLGAAGVKARRSAEPFQLLGQLLEDPDENVRIAALAAVPPTASLLAEQIAGYIHSPGGRITSAAARALTRISGDDAGDVVAALLLSAIGASKREVVRAAADAVGEALVDLDPASEPFPGWFKITNELGALYVSPQAREVMAALKRASAGADQRTAQAITGAFGSIHHAVKQKRSSRFAEHAGFYFFEHFGAPSQEQDNELLASLEEAATGSSGNESRYLDATFFQDDNRLPDGAALREGQSYDLEVAIRVMPTGIPVVGQRLAVAELPPETGEAKLVVVAEARGGLSVAEPVARLTLPAERDSTANAWFRITAQSASVSADALGEIRLRVYYQLSLLESAVIRAEVVSEFRAERSALDLDLPIVIKHDQIERGYVGLPGESARSLHISVGRQGTGYALEFIWKDSEGNILTLSAPATLTSAELSDLLGDVRQALLKVTMGDTYADNLKGSANQYLATMRNLAAVGQRLYIALFRRKRSSAIFAVGQLLLAMPPALGSVIQISVRDDASDFLFPWALLYDGELPEEQWELPDPDGFWGLRYCIEQRLPGTQRRLSPRPRPRPMRMAFMLWDQFRNTAEHRAMIEVLARGHRDELKVSLPPITRESDAMKALQATDPNDIMYFYTHAHIRRRPHSGPDAFTKAFLSLPENAAARKSFRQAYDRAIADAAEPSWIGLTYGRLKLDELYKEEINFANSPLVILNACESAELTPALSGESFVGFFLDRGAATFLGTECTMTVTFAHPFGEAVLSEIAAGATIGAAVLAARRHFTTKLRNPLGLAYSLYGNACWSFQPTGDPLPG